MEELKKVSGIEAAVAEMRSGFAREYEELEIELKPYINGVVTEETLQAWKKDRASLNKRKKDNESRRTGIASDWASKLDPISIELKGITHLYDQAISNIDKQTKEFENARKRARQDAIRVIWEKAEKPAELADWLDLTDVFESSWLNASTSDKKIKDAIKMAFDQLEMSYNTVKGMNHKYEEEGLKELKRTRQLADAVTRMNALQQQEELIERKRREREELERLERERREREEAERKEREEAERKAREEAEEKKKREESERKEMVADAVADAIFSDGPLPDKVKLKIESGEMVTVDTNTGEIVDEDDELPEEDECIIDALIDDYDDELPEEPKKRIRVDLEIHEDDMMKLVEILDASGIYYTIY